MTTIPITTSHNNSGNEFCSSCGYFVDELDETTGWCYNCARLDNNDRTGSVLSVSKMELALRANADRVEFYISTANASVSQALLLAQQDGPTCIVCGNPMKHASRGALICRKNKECRRISRRYTYLYRERGLTKIEAIAQIMGELSG